MQKSKVDKFWSYVLITNNCWRWCGAVSSSGYGRFRIGNRLESVHRISWELTNGPIPEDLFILHKCDNKRCVKPDHLYLGTPSNNMVDRAHRNPESQGGMLPVLIYSQAIEIIQLYKTGMFSQRNLAKIFKCSTYTIAGVLTGRIINFLPEDLEGGQEEPDEDS